MDQAKHQWEKNLSVENSFSKVNFGIVTIMDDWNVRKIANNLIKVYQ